MIELVWHYTFGEAFRSILENGLIMPATANVSERERPIVWFSTNQEWDQTVPKGLMKNGVIVDLDREAMIAAGLRLGRIGVSPVTAPYLWSTLKRLSRMNDRMSRGLVAAALAKGADPMEWRGTFESVPREKWVAVEVWQDSRFVPYVAEVHATVRNEILS